MVPAHVANLVTAPLKVSAGSLQGIPARLVGLTATLIEAAPKIVGCTGHSRYAASLAHHSGPLVPVE